MNFIQSYWKGIIWAIVIITLSLISANRIPDMGAFKIPHLDKLVHFFMYFIFSVLLVEGHSNLFGSGKMVRAVLPAITFSIVFGLFMEFMQTTITTDRYAEFLDFAANTFGAIIGGITSKFILTILSKRIPYLFRLK